MLTTVTTAQRFQCGKSSQIMVMTQPVNEAADPIPSVSNIKKNMTAKNYFTKNSQKQNQSVKGFFEVQRSRSMDVARSFER